MSDILQIGIHYCIEYILKHGKILLLLPQPVPNLVEKGGGFSLEPASRSRRKKNAAETCTEHSK